MWSTESGEPKTQRISVSDGLWSVSCTGFYASLDGFVGGGKESEGGFETEQELMNELVSRLGGSLWVNGCSIRKRVLLLLVLYLPLSLYLP